jgi:hypothetical protein
MYRDGEPVLLPDGRDLEKALAEAVERLPKNIYQAENQKPAPRVSEVNIPAPDYIKPNAFCVHEDGRVCIREDDKLRPLDDMAVETRSRIRRLIEVRDAVRVCLRSQLDGSSEEQVVEARLTPTSINVLSTVIPICRCSCHWSITTMKGASQPKPRFSTSEPFTIKSPSNPSAHPKRRCSSRSMKKAVLI